MQMFNLIILCISFWCINGYEIPPVQVEILDDGFRVSIPDTPGIESVLYMIKINEQCPPILDYMAKLTGTRWISTQNQRLFAKNLLEVDVAVNQGGRVHTRSERFRIGVDKSLKSIPQQDVELNDMTCDRVEIPVNPTDNCRIPITVSSHKQPTCAYELIFEENFNEANYRDQWKHEVYIPRYSDRRLEFVMYDELPNVTYVRDGYLHISPYLNPNDIGNKENMATSGRCTQCDPDLCAYRCKTGAVYPPASISAKLRSKFSFKYGRIEVRAKLSKGDWLVPLVMLANDYDCNTMYSAQLRVASIRGNDNNSETQHRGNQLFAGPVVLKQITERGRNDYTRDSKMTKNKADTHFGEDFHNYTLLWKDDKISVARDGIAFGCFPTDSKYFAEQLNIVLAVSVGGMFEFKNEKMKKKESELLAMPWDTSDMKAPHYFWQSFQTSRSHPWNPADATMKIDYIRVYAV